MGHPHAENPPHSVAWPWLDIAPAVEEASGYWAARTVLLTIAASLTRLLFISTNGLSDTEAYYIAWARFPAWSYYDHPPMIAWLVKAMQWVALSPFAVRLVPLICAAGLAWALFKLGERLFSPRAGYIAALVITTSPTFIFTSFLVNPEGPLHPLWVFALLAVFALRDQREAWRPLLLGVLIGLSFLSKYTGLLLVPITVAFVAFTPSARHWLKRPAFYGSGLLALVIATPVIIWNATHDWPTVSLHLVERMGVVSIADNARHFVLMQWLGFHPLIVPGLVLGLMWALPRAWRDDRYRLLVLASGPVLAFFAFAMIRASDAEPHWPAVAYLSLAVVAGAWLDAHIDNAGRMLKGYVRAALGLSIAIVVVYFAHTQTPVFAEALPGYDAQSDPANETKGWDEVRAAILQDAELLGPDTAVVGSHNVLCGHLLVALDDSPQVYCASPRRTEFDFIGRHEPAPGTPILYVDNAHYAIDPATLFPTRVCHEVETFPVTRGSLEIARFRMAACLTP